MQYTPKQVFPNPAREPPPPGHKGFKAANGSRIPIGGFLQTEARLAEGNSKTIRWKHVDAEMPILPTNELSQNNRKVIYDEDEGEVVNTTTGNINTSIQTNGVCFLPLYVPKQMVHSEAADMSFQRPR